MKQSLARKLLGLFGWKLEGAKPEYPQYVLIAAPHTSNWDFPLMLLFAAAFDMKVTWMAKHSLFWPPLSWLMRAMGGMPIVRHKSTNTVDSMIAAFCSTEGAGSGGAHGRNPGKSGALEVWFLSHRQTGECTYLPLISGLWPKTRGLWSGDHGNRQRDRRYELFS